MTAPASPPVAVGVDDAIRFCEELRAYAVSMGGRDLPAHGGDYYRRQVAAMDTALRALASPVSGDGSSADADTHRATDNSSSSDEGSV